MATATADSSRRAEVLLLSLHSPMYPSIGETHGLAVIAGAIGPIVGGDHVSIVDLGGLGESDLAPALQLIQERRPTVLGISVQYGTFSILRQCYPSLVSALPSGDHLVLFGGALATYLADDILAEIDKDAVVVIGEGDHAASAVLERWMKKESFAGIPNLRYVVNGNFSTEVRALANLADVPPPDRRHLHQITSRSGQVFAESGRGCSWAACTFCLRGLSDVRGTPQEHRRFPAARTLRDLLELKRVGVSAVTFADEDFLAGSLQSIECFVYEFVESAERLRLNMTFDISATVHSICSRHDTTVERERRLAAIQALQSVGLRKVFLGVESGSYTQSRRYAKGHTPGESHAACQQLARLGVDVEIGWIMFDPLCTPNEVGENVSFLRSTGLVHQTSYIANELRLQPNSAYVRILDGHERRLGYAMYERDVDRDTMSHRYRYADPEIQAVVDTVRACGQEMRPIHYPVKNLIRYGRHGALGEQTTALRGSLSALRGHFLDAIEAGLRDPMAEYENSEAVAIARGGLTKLANDVVTILSELPPERRAHPIIENVYRAAADLAVAADRG